MVSAANPNPAKLNPIRAASPNKFQASSILFCNILTFVTDQFSDICVQFVVWKFINRSNWLEAVKYFCLGSAVIPCSFFLQSPGSRRKKRSLSGEMEDHVSNKFKVQSYGAHFIMKGVLRTPANQPENSDSQYTFVCTFVRRLLNSRSAF